MCSSRIILMMMAGVVLTDLYKPLYPGFESRFVQQRLYFLGRDSKYFFLSRATLRQMFLTTVKCRSAL